VERKQYQISQIVSACALVPQYSRNIRTVLSHILSHRITVVDHVICLIKNYVPEQADTQ
jgi:hypothetical protein